MVLKLFETPLSLQNEYKNYLQTNGFIDRMMTVDDFLKRVLLFDDKTFIESDTRVLLLREAADFEEFEKLKFKRDFIPFLESSSFIFSFFEECSNELVELEKLKKADLFAEYFERVDVLIKLRERYKRLLEEKDYIDPIFMPFEYRLNISFLNSFTEIVFYQKSYLNSFLTDIFFKISQIVSFKVDLVIDEFNEIVEKRYEKYGFDFEGEGEYLLDFTQRKILEKNPLVKRETKYEILGVSNPLLEVAFAKKKIFDFYQKGINPENIAVIVNSEEYFKYLKSFNDEEIFTFFNSFTFKESLIYKKLKAVYEYLNDESYENFYRLKRLNFDPETIEERFFSIWNEKVKKEEISKIFESFKDYEDRDVFVYEEELFSFLKLYPHLKNYPFKTVFHLFLNRLEERKIEEGKEGIVKVLNLFDARGVDFEGVIVLGFNEGKGIKNPFNDLFLSSSLRYQVGMPTAKDMQNIQKSIYSSLFKNAKEVAISYLKDEQNRPLKFLYELGLKENISLDSEKLGEVLFKSVERETGIDEEDIVLEYDFKNEILSPFKLKMFFECKRKYYLWYIKEIEDFVPPSDKIDDRVIGKYLHKALEYLYKDGEIFEDEKRLIDSFRSLLLKEVEDNEVLKLSADIWIERLKSFAKKEVERFKNGFKPVMVEKRIEKDYMGFRIQGVIDRIDVRDGKFYIIDYKSGAVPKVSKRNLQKESNFQLQIYYRLLENMVDDIGGLYYCDLNSGEWIEEDLFEEKLVLFDEKLKTLEEREINFEKTDDFSKCRFCPYTIICQRE